MHDVTVPFEQAQDLAAKLRGRVGIQSVLILSCNLSALLPGTCRIQSILFLLKERIGQYSLNCGYCCCCFVVAVSSCFIS